jgi:hypothetical protein
MDIKNYDKHFPSFEKSEINYDFYFQYELVYLYFHSFHKSDTIISSLSKRLDNALFLLKKQLRNKRAYPISIIYLKYYYKLLIHTRDIIDGKGEHSIVYSWINIWYKHFPSLVIYFLYSLSYNGVIDHLGSWRDMKYLCEYVKNQSPKKREDHPLIDHCVCLINKH